MNWFDFLFFFVFTTGLTALWKLRFFLAFAGLPQKKRHYVLYLALTYSMELCAQWLQSYWAVTVFHMLCAIGLGYCIWKISLSTAALAAILAECVGLLAFGMAYSVSSAFSPLLTAVHTGLGAYLGIGAILLSLLLTYTGFQVVQKKFQVDQSVMKQYFTLFFLPVLFVLLACGYISNTFYGNVIVADSAGVIQPGVNHWLMLLFQSLAGLLLFGTLYACRKLSEGFAAQTRLALLEQQLITQRDYLQEAYSRYEQTQAFRHDIKNHLSALHGLLEHGETQQAKEYLGKLDTVSESLSFPCKTGNTVVDTLLSAKLGTARQKAIQLSCTVRTPPPGAVDDLDLCVLFSNALDNAIRACSQVETGAKYIHISGKEKGDFFMLEVENSCACTGGYQKGIGLSNIETVAEKYHGAVTAEQQGSTFRLNVLLIISRSVDDISA